MVNDSEIGRVVTVDTAEVTIELNRELKGMTRNTYEGSQEVGRINSYVIIPVGTKRLVAMITSMVLIEEPQWKADPTTVALPSARRLMKATLVGTIYGTSFRQGVSIFPLLDSSVQLAQKADYDAIFGPIEVNTKELSDLNEPLYCIPIGESAIMQGRPVRIDPDAFFGKHAAILGSTGSGKSCTIASILQSIHSQKEVNRTTCVILDTNGEYRSAFQEQDAQDQWENSGQARCLYVPSDPGESNEHLAIPYWFMDANEFARIFRAKQGLQEPVLLQALRLARAGSTETGSVITIIEVLRTAARRILVLCENDAPSQQWAIPKNLVTVCDDGLRFKDEFPDYVEMLNEKLGPAVFENWEHALTQVKEVGEFCKSVNSLGGTSHQQIRDIIEPIIERLNHIIAQNPSTNAPVSADQPLYFDRSQFFESALKIAMREQVDSGNTGRVRDACGPMFLRIQRFLEDPRFRFLFDRFPNLENVLATFLRDLLGIKSLGDESQSSTGSDTRNYSLPFYTRQKSNAEAADIVILDLSLLSSEVLENVTALIGRLILEFLQRLGEHGGDAARGSLPVVLVLEEAQNYIQSNKESIAREVFERIAREGRKYGLGLVVASQRPSELSKTVLSQCNSFVVHRLQNPEDLRYFREIVPGIYGPILEQIPTLSPQTALILGECVAAPALVKIREANPLPDSWNPRFYEYWTLKQPPSVPVEEICSRWENPQQSARVS